MSLLLFKSRVVVVDDEPTVASLFAQYLDGSFRVDWFAEPGKALAFLRQHRVELLITDLIMPGINGLNLTGQAKAMQPALKVIMISGVNPWAWAQGDRNLDLVDAYLAKPVNLKDLEKCCHRVLKDPVSQVDPQGRLYCCPLPA